MNFDSLLSSIITATSISIAVGFPFLIFITTNFKNRKEKLLYEMKTYFPKLNAFIELIYYISLTGVVKNYDLLLRKARTEIEKEEIRNIEAYRFYKAVDYISRQYKNHNYNEYFHKRDYSFDEIKNYHLYSNAIWYDIDCRTDIVKELNLSQFDNLHPYEKERIQKTISLIRPKYKVDKITISLIASVAGGIETEVTSPLLYLTKKYEEPLPSLVRNLFHTLSFSILIGVVIPLLMLQFECLQKSWISIILIILITICYIFMVLLTSRYIRKIQKE